MGQRLYQKDWCVFQHGYWYTFVTELKRNLFFALRYKLYIHISLCSVILGISVYDGNITVVKVVTYNYKI